MAEETAEGIAYLRALKHPDVSAAAPARETSEGSGVDFSMTPARFRTEKRRSARYKCEGSIEIQEDGRDVRTWATFTDISVHGCYVEAQATYPVGTLLHLRLELNGLRVECKAASVRVTYPHLGMGIAFVDMSEESRARLKEVMSSISRPAVIMGSRIMGPRLIAPLPSTGPADESLAVPDPKAAIDALFTFFESRHMLLHEDFLAIVAKSQTGAIRS
jgi:hypothetical protein